MVKSYVTLIYLSLLFNTTSMELLDTDDNDIFKKPLLKEEHIGKIEILNENNKKKSVFPPLDTFYIMPFNMEVLPKGKLLSEEEILKCYNFGKYILHSQKPLLVSVAQNLYNGMIKYRGEKAGETYKSSFFAFRITCKNFRAASFEVKVRSGQALGEIFEENTQINSNKKLSIGEFQEALIIRRNLVGSQYLTRENFQKELVQYIKEENAEGKYSDVIISLAYFDNISLETDEISKKILDKRKRRESKEFWGHLSPLLWQIVSLGANITSIVIMSKTPIWTIPLVTTELKMDFSGKSGNNYKRLFPVLPYHIAYTSDGFGTYTSDQYPKTQLYEKYANFSRIPMNAWTNASANYEHTENGGFPLFREISYLNYMGIAFPILGLTLQVIPPLFLGCRDPAFQFDSKIPFQTKDLNLNKTIGQEDILLKTLQEKLQLWEIQWPSSSEIRKMVSLLYNKHKTVHFRESEEFESFLNMAHAYVYCPNFRLSKAYKNLLFMKPETYKRPNFKFKHYLWVTLNRDSLVKLLYGGFMMSNWMALSLLARHHSTTLINWSSQPDNVLQGFPLFPSCPQNLTDFQNQNLTQITFNPYQGAGIVYRDSLDSIPQQRFNKITQDPVYCNLIAKEKDLTVYRAESFENAKYPWAASFAFATSLIQFSAIFLYIIYLSILNP